MTSDQAAQELGVSRNTLLRWFREGRISAVSRDRHGWRVFTEADLTRIRRELGEATPPPTPEERTRWSRMRAYLRRVPLFKKLPDTVLDELVGCARFQGLLRGQQLFRPGERPLGLPILVKGKIRVFRTSQDGREQTLAVATPYQTLGEAGLFGAREQQGSHAVCLESSTVIILPRARLRQLCGEHPQLAEAFLRELARRIQDLEERLEGQTLLSLEQRLARTLLSWAGASDELVMELNLTELASLLGGARESLSRALLRFAREGWIVRDGRRIEVLDPEALGRL